MKVRIKRRTFSCKFCLLSFKTFHFCRHTRLPKWSPTHREKCIKYCYYFRAMGKILPISPCSAMYVSQLFQLFEATNFSCKELRSQWREIPVQQFLKIQFWAFKMCQFEENSREIDEIWQKIWSFNQLITRDKKMMMIWKDHLWQPMPQIQLPMLWEICHHNHCNPFHHK